MDCEHKHYEVVEAHPWQRLEESDDGVHYTVAESGNDLECRCRDCGEIFWIK